MIRVRDIAVFSDEPYDQMVWRGRHQRYLHSRYVRAMRGAYTFSKSYSMSGWRLGFAVSSPTVIEQFSTLLNTSLSCVAPLAQLAGAAALEHDTAERDRPMRLFQGKVELLVRGLNQSKASAAWSRPRRFTPFRRWRPSATVCESRRRDWPCT